MVAQPLAAGLGTRRPHLDAVGRILCEPENPVAVHRSCPQHATDDDRMVDPERFVVGLLDVPLAEVAEAPVVLLQAPGTPPLVEPRGCVLNGSVHRSTSTAATASTAPRSYHA